MKIYKKEELTYKNGYLIDGEGNVVPVDNEVVDLFNKVETDYQQALYAKTHKFQLPEFEPFKRESEFDNIRPVFEVDTPKLEEEFANALEMMDELDELEKADKINRYIDGIMPVISFIVDDSVVACEASTPHRFDLPTIGSPLIDRDAILAILNAMARDE